MRKVSDRKRIMISADNAFQRTGLTGLRIPGIDIAAHWSAPENHVASFFIIPRLRAGDFERRGNQTERRKTAPLPSSATYHGGDGKQVKVLFQRAVFNGMNGVEIFTKQLGRRIVFSSCQRWRILWSPCRLRRRGMGASKHAVAVKAVIFAVEFSVCTNCVMVCKSCQ